ncbi:MAG: hypothetical protein A2430_02265 [Candidatus Liptonbacteria bacterium RIFOXYC1_FULL_36_8]|uniref:S1 motif domain-containing protein n=3 Tax=Candidatus Liptoniibacteriota TaxID=1817909 RepID=A0A1G2CN92_9BACT|nr:MAG: hypothetical protein A2390_00890 [Candidatus Liptonbacteria bacterium RIFOXYB1_FULL_36_10]OGZ02882.1 MAG: hypothetical protein A2430_02265 [Candidatus Liptonbacteria bacterium RIFOXYC1_FULL_36_8]OGZ03577.1 MAG: hypothetical protein A2604_00260 [Candidatus Liptonbacteria bacterium RIFOXYD1_FULL_36_11]
MAITIEKLPKKISVFAGIMKAEPELFVFLKEGDLVEAEFIGKEKGKAFFNLGRYGTGVVFGREFLNAREIIRELEQGRKMTAKVAMLDNENGYIELSLTEADKQKVWQELKEMKDSGEAFTVKITGVNAGGLTTDIKEIKAFLPVSQLSNEHYPRVGDFKEKILEELKKFVDGELQVKIITVNPKANKLIISEREITDENVQELLKKYKVGDVVDGIISGVADFGAFIRFVNDPEVEGLIHISELDHKLVENPKEIVKVDESVKAMITDIKEGRVSLSLKALKPDPWKGLEEKFKEGQRVKGIPFKYNPFGAFVNVEGALVQGLIHVSEFGGVEEMKNVLELGRSYEFVIDVLKPEEKRLILKIKKVEKEKEKEEEKKKEEKII